MAHLYLSAAHKSSGKTTVALGMCAALRRRGLTVQPFKKGPDYIDPMWLGRAAGRTCHNLDFNTQSHAEIRESFANRMQGADLGIVEGNVGLFDGMDVEGNDSNAALAKLLGAPVILILDATGMSRGIAPLLLGYQAFDPDLNIAGVIVNHVAGSGHERKLRAAIERYTDVEILGTISRNRDLAITERHLGLVPSNEADAADEKIATIADSIAAQVDLTRLVEIGSLAETIPSAARVPPRPSGPSNVRVGVARDAAFGFYYPGDLEALERAGATLVMFDTLRDTSLPAVDALFLGGGFPETHMRQLESNATLRASIRGAIESGLPAYAECGGLMYLCRSLQWNGETANMVGVIPADAVMHPRPVGRGYVVLEQTGNNPWPLPSAKGEPVRFPAHEFHYSSLESLPDHFEFAFRVIRGTGLGNGFDGIVYKNLLACYAHQRDVAGNNWAMRFVEFVRKCPREADSPREAGPESDD